MSTATSRIRRRSRVKNAAFAVVTVLMLWGITEVICWGALLYFEQLYTISVQQQQVDVLQGGETRRSSVEAIHPYLGWVLNPQVYAESKLFDRTIPVNALGFNDEDHGIPKRRPDRLIVAVTGGSVAWQVSVAGEKKLRERLDDSPLLRDKRLQIVRLAMSGYKQPQQLMALNYMLALGAEFDFVVNIDGYNEVALTMAENVDSGVFAVYPRMWQARLQDVVDPRKYSLSFELLQYRAQRQQMAADRLQSWLPWSPMLNLVWLTRDKRMESRIADLGLKLRNRKLTEGFGFAVKGPSQFGKGDRLEEQVVDLWSNCSRQMQRVCAGNGIAYIHILQPNQYLAGSKPMTPAERKKCVSATQDYGREVAKLYPRLRERVDELQLAHVDFHDLTMLFEKVETPIYVDAFCHYNQQGNDLLAQAIADAIQKYLELRHK